VIATSDPRNVTPEQKYWFNLVEEAYHVGFNKYVEIVEKNLPAKHQEQALVNFFKSKSKEIEKKIGKKIAFEKQKPYTGTHNAGYTECQEFYGAITLESESPLAEQVVTMLDVAIRGVGNRWDDVVIPGLDFVVIENTLAKFGSKAETLNKIPLNVQTMVGNIDELK